ncbi:AMP-binding protein [Mycobacterium seoulense]|uniref:Long-chain-fatty-acid--CoA ligase FadD13 n=1 Tax=Mycobacterium seoulense TaxID=386911 RepID=A0A7I7P1X1_9MYCO|nr:MULTISPECIES: AMP-binding protein [Mycobacterium]MCV7437474.1 AMP-binding protein [Mycobacterium seoulense]OBH29110.1 acyl-CoA synthetase [Mycobacterium sp. E342]BBY02520.1 acyl-CoA synthetase [Mycobacterium seoulense]
MQSEFWFEPLTPVSFLRRAATIYGDNTAVVDGERTFSYRELLDRSTRLAGALIDLAGGKAVAILAPNSHALLEAHYGVPWSGSPLLTLNIRLSAPELAWIIDHAEAAVLIYDSSLSTLAHAVSDIVDSRMKLVCCGGENDEYEQLLAEAEPRIQPITDENALLSLNYTSGTTGKPKGVMYHHRGAYLQSVAMATQMRLENKSKMLWTLPMFHCHGWCFTWAVTAAGGAHICLRSVDHTEIWRLIDDEGVTHLNGAPVVLNSIAYGDAAHGLVPPRNLLIGTGGAPPTPTILARLAALNMDVVHLYGLTETYGPVVICEWQRSWDSYDAPRRARLKARQGVCNIVSQPVRVLDANGDDVPKDGRTMGEVAIRGNNVMAGYFKDPGATEAAVPDGWFRTGDLGVLHEDGYLELRDRSKDIIISGGENISSIEVENAIASHESVLEVAVVAVPDDRWGEVPVAHITLHPGATADQADIERHVREQLGGFKVPKRIVFEALPKTGTGKVQKFALREQWRQKLQSPDLTV